jgi:ribosome biogenesis GTPase / thiamine phosphate phosphatase
VGTLLESTGGVYRVLPDGAESVLEAFLRGRLKQEVRTGERLVAGDRVRLAPTVDGGWTVEEVAPRRSELVRAGLRGRKAKVVAANVDLAVIVTSLVRPPLRTELVDRFLVLAGVSDLDRLVVANKLDLPQADAEAERLESHLGASGIPVLRTCALSGVGVEPLGARLRGRTSVLMGPSGVGKSSLLNAIFPGLELRTGDVGKKTGGGRHTTVGARLIPLPGGGSVVDTPGFSDVAAWAPEPGEVATTFPEIAERAEGCRFRGCTHLHEPGCAVREALDDGEIPPARFESYRRLILEE